MDYLTDKLTRKEHALLTDEQKRKRKRAHLNARMKVYYAKPESIARKKAYKASKLTHFVVYMHSNSSGNIYIGSGWNVRPYRIWDSLRTPNWIAAFKGAIVCIEILGKFDSKKEAHEAEKALIAKIGLDNLVNVLH